MAESSKTSRLSSQKEINSASKQNKQQKQDPAKKCNLLQSQYGEKISDLLRRYQLQSKQNESLVQQLRTFQKQRSTKAEVYHQIRQNLKVLQSSRQQGLRLQLDLKDLTQIQCLKKQINQLKIKNQALLLLKQQQTAQLKTIKQRYQQNLQVQNQKTHNLSHQLGQKSKQLNQEKQKCNMYQEKLSTINFQHQKLKNSIKESINLQNQIIPKNTSTQQAQLFKKLQAIQQQNKRLHQSNQKYSKQIQNLKIKVQYELIPKKQAQQSIQALQAEHMKQTTQLYAQLYQSRDQVFAEKIEQANQTFQTNLTSIKAYYQQKTKKESQFYLLHLQNFKQIIEEKQQSINKLKTTHRVQLAKEIQQKKSYILNLQNIIGKIQTVIFNQPYSIIQNSNIISNIQRRINRLKEKTEEAQSQSNMWKTKYESIQKEFSQIKRYLGKINIFFRNNQNLDSLVLQIKAFQQNQQIQIIDNLAFESFKILIKSITSLFQKNQEVINKLKISKGQLTKDLQNSKQCNSSLQQKNEFLQRTLKETREQYLKQQQQQSKIYKDKVKQLGQQIGAILKSNNDKQIVIAQNEKQIVILNKSAESMKQYYQQKIQDFTRIISQQQKANLTAGQKKRNLQNQLAQSKSSIQQLQLLMKQKEKKAKNQQQENTNKLRETINELYQCNLSQDITLDYLLKQLKQNSQKITPFAVSPILSAAPKQRNTLIPFICRFLKLNSFNTIFLYKYDEFNKNFSNYLPIKTNHDYVIIVRSNKKQIFGVVSSGLGKQSKAMAFNLNQQRLFQGDPNLSSSNFDGTYLIFGQGQIRFRSNWNLQVVVNSRMFGKRYFNFKKEELAGPNEQGESIVLQSMQIHKINS